MRISLLLASLTTGFVAAACADDGEAVGDGGFDDAGADAGSGSDASIDVADVGTDALDGSGTADSGDGSGAGDRRLLVARTFLFEREAGPGVAEGFDLDGRQSGVGDTAGCSQTDFTSASGVDGIDNQFARLLPVIEAAGGSALPSLIQAAIDEGDLLLMFAFDGVDDVVNDDNVSITIVRGLADPLLTADGKLQPNQTFDIDPAEAPSTVYGAELVDGVLEAGPFVARLPIFVFDFRFDVTLFDARARVWFDQSGPVRAMIGGTVSLENVLTIARNEGIQSRIPDLIEQVGYSMADLRVTEESERCDGLSVAATVELIPAFVYPDAVWPAQ